VNYAEKLNKTLRPKPNGKPLVIDLFAGCGGLSLGFEAQGFATRGFEMDRDCCGTYQKNLTGKCEEVILTPETPLPSAPVVIGGPPCQPFSVGGHQHGLKDSRDGFPIFIAAIKKLQPEIWLFENVRGLLYSNKWYFDEIVAALQSLGYVVEYELLNASHYGVPQNRERVVVVGHRGNFSFPLPQSTVVSAGEALADTIHTAPPKSKFLTASMDAYVAKYEKASFCVRPRDLHPDEPARTVTCRNLAGATGDMHRVRLPDGRRRRLLAAEASRLQSFPDHFEFCGGETSVFNQIGNAVAPLFAWHLAASVRAYLNSTARLSSSEILYRNLPKQMSLSLVHEDTPMNIPEFVDGAGKPKAQRKLINEALFILAKLGVPLDGLTSRRLEKMALAFLAVADVHRSSDWSNAKGFNGTRALKSREIIAYINRHFAEKISPGSYDDIRRKDLKLPVAAGIVIKSAANPDAARNDPTRAYALAPDCAGIVRAFGADNWDELIDEYLADKTTLAEQLAAARELKRVPIVMPDGKKLTFSPGEHNRLQKAVIEEFLPRYGNGSEILYVGDTADKFLHLDKRRLKDLNFFELSHGELPDILAYSSTKNWLYLIECVHSSGPISPIRLAELLRLTKDCRAEVVFVTAFLNRDTFRRFAPDIAWETEVWIADAPDHVVHFDGDKFFGPYARKH
jgi:DNA (cytosine-5)-methyltransferase 1